MPSFVRKLPLPVLVGLLALAAGALIGRSCTPAKVVEKEREKVVEKLKEDTKARARVVELERQVEALRLQLQFRTQKIEITKPDGTVFKKETTDLNVAVDQSKEANRSSAAEHAETAHKEAEQTREAERLKVVELVPKYRLGPDVGVKVGEWQPNVGLTGQVRLGDTPLSLMLQFNSKLEGRVGLNWEFR